MTMHYFLIENMNRSDNPLSKQSNTTGKDTQAKKCIA